MITYRDKKDGANPFVGFLIDREEPGTFNFKISGKHHNFESLKFGKKFTKEIKSVGGVVTISRRGVNKELFVGEQQGLFVIMDLSFLHGIEVIRFIVKDKEE